MSTRVGPTATSRVDAPSWACRGQLCIEDGRRVVIHAVRARRKQLEEIGNQAEELSRVFEEESEPAASEEEAAVRAAGLRRVLAESEPGQAVATAGEAGVAWIASLRKSERVAKPRQKYRVLVGKERPVPTDR